jgi:hypothetical protein
MQKYWEKTWHLFGLCWLILTILATIFNVIEGIKAMLSGSTITGYYWASVISSVAFLLGFILLTIHYIPIWIKEKKKGKVIVGEQYVGIKDEVIGGVGKEVFNRLQTMDAEKTKGLFDGMSKLSPEQIVALFYGRVGEKQEYKKVKGKRKST